MRTGGWVLRAAWCTGPRLSLDIRGASCGIMRLAREPSTLLPQGWPYRTSHPLESPEVDLDIYSGLFW
jgi:hypothetical protein